MDLWNEANTKHRRLMTMLMTFPGIVVMTARGKEVAALDAAGRPVEGSKEYRSRARRTSRSTPRVDPGVPRPPADGRRCPLGPRRRPPGRRQAAAGAGLTLEKVVFDILRCNPAEAEVRQLVELSTEPEETPPADDDRPRANALRDWAFRPERTGEELREALAKLKAEHQQRANLLVVNEHGDDEVLSVLLQRRIHDARTAMRRQSEGGSE
jgi:hypothetical protein